MSVLRACMNVYHVHSWYPWMSEESVRFFRAIVIVDCEPPWEYWELIPGSAERATSALYH